jgi:hypothetical protein
LRFGMIQFDKSKNFYAALREGGIIDGQTLGRRTRGQDMAGPAVLTRV